MVHFAKPGQMHGIIWGPRTWTVFFRGLHGLRAARHPWTWTLFRCDAKRNVSRQDVRGDKRGPLSIRCLHLPHAE